MLYNSSIELIVKDMKMIVFVQFKTSLNNLHRPY
jgi:hypothetical protein